MRLLLNTIEETECTMCITLEQQGSDESKEMCIIVISYAFYSFLSTVPSLIVILILLVYLYSILWPQGHCNALLVEHIARSV